MIKNSWGTDWGASGPYPGCAWVAYGAANLGDSTSAIAGYKIPDDIIFYHDECGWLGHCADLDAPTPYGAVRFRPSQNATLTAVDFWAVDTNMEYEIKIFDTLNTYPTYYTFSNQRGTTQTGGINELGYYSIPLNTPVELVSGNDFIVQIKLLTTTGWEYPIPIDYCVDPDMNWAAIATSSGESYASCDGSQFEKYGEDGIDIGIRARVEVGVTQPFDTGSGTYPSIFGTHTGTITPSYDVNVSRMYTYPCAGTGGHTEYVRIYGDVVDESKTWDGYTGDYHNITFDSQFTLEAGKTYNYEIRTGSYPQIIHESTKEVTGGTINCTQFTDANEKTYTDWIPAIKFF